MTNGEVNVVWPTGDLVAKCAPVFKATGANGGEHIENMDVGTSCLTLLWPAAYGHALLCDHAGTGVDPASSWLTLIWKLMLALLVLLSCCFIGICLRIKMLKAKCLPIQLQQSLLDCQLQCAAPGEGRGCDVEMVEAEFVTHVTTSSAGHV